MNNRAFVLSFSSCFRSPRSVTRRRFWTLTALLKVGDILCKVRRGNLDQTSGLSDLCLDCPVKKELQLAFTILTNTLPYALSVGEKMSDLSKHFS